MRYIHPANLTGQRPDDVTRLSESHITGDVLNVRQGMISAKLRIKATVEPADLIAEIQQY